MDDVKFEQDLVHAFDEQALGTPWRVEEQQRGREDAGVGEAMRRAGWQVDGVVGAHRQRAFHSAYGHRHRHRRLGRLYRSAPG